MLVWGPFVDGWEELGFRSETRKSVYKSTYPQNTKLLGFHPLYFEEAPFHVFTKITEKMKKAGQGGTMAPSPLPCIRRWPNRLLTS